LKLNDKLVHNGNRKDQGSLDTVKSQGKDSKVVE